MEQTQNQQPPRVVILGGGYAGIYTALGLQRATRRGKIELCMVSRENFFLFQPMLAEVVSGSIEPPPPHHQPHPTPPETHHLLPG